MLCRIILAGCLLAGLAGGAEKPADVGPYLEAVRTHYFNVLNQLPETFTAEMRSPELVESHPALERAVGDGHIRVNVRDGKLDLRTENLANPQLGKLIDGALGVLKGQLNAHMPKLQIIFPDVVATLALQPQVKTDTDGFVSSRNGEFWVIMKSRSAQTEFQQAALQVGKHYQVHKIWVLNKKGETIEASLTNTRNRATHNRWVITRIEAKVSQQNAPTTHMDVKLDYTTVGRHVVFRRIEVAEENAAGQPIDKGKEPNPVSFRFSNYRLE